MKNAIKYFYDLDIDSIRQLSDSFFIEKGFEKYYLKNVNEKNIETNNTIKMTENSNIFHKIILNTNGQAVTNINGNLYVLMKTNCSNRAINKNDIYITNNFYVRSDIDVVTKSINLWEQKVDYYEYQISQIGKKYPLLKESFSYYDGLTENGIQLLKMIDGKNIGNYLSHSRIKHQDSLIELYDPINLIIDSKVRDVAEYYKSIFWDNPSKMAEIKDYLSTVNIEEICLFYARMMYPSYYFDMYEEIVQDKIEETKIMKYINKVDDYESFLRELYEYLRINYKMPNIEWLIKT